MIRLVVFDMAGTTVEEGGAVYQAIAAAVGSHLDREVPDEELSRWTGAEKREAIAGLLQSLDGAAPDDVVEELFADFSARLDDAYLAEPPSPIPGVADLFSTLRRSGIRVALTTGFTDRVARGILDGLGWTVGTDVDALVTAEQVGAGRPSPLMIQRAMELTDTTDPDEVVVVGDTLRDLQAGMNAGARAVVGVLTGAQPERVLAGVPGAHVLRSAIELPELIASLDAAGTSTRNS